MADSRSLRERVAGQSAMAEVVRAQRASAGPGRLARFFGASPLTSDARQAYRGALGELTVGDMLERLGSRWDVLHDLPLGNSVLDHLVIGPAGVFAVVVTNCTERDVVIDGADLLIAGEPGNQIAAASARADAAASLLADATGEHIRVRPLLVLVEPRKLVVRRPASVVRVVESTELERMLTRAARTLTGDEVAAISDHADLESTWPTPPAGTFDVQRLHQDFAVVREEVRAALLRRVLWGVLAFAVVYALTVGTIATLVASMVNL